jgi:hypothetical protein
VWFFPFVPLPVQPQCTIEALQVKHSLRPPNRLGRCTLLQLTRQCPPRASSLPRHKKFLWILSIFLIAHLDRGNTVIWYRTTAESIEFTKARLPDLFNNLPFHHGSLPATLSTNICSSSRFILPMRSGRPKYLHGSYPCLICRLPIT